MFVYHGPAKRYDNEVRLNICKDQTFSTKAMIRYMDIPLLVSWLSARQYAPEGGFSGRTNKLVDGCYSHWVGDCWPLVQSALNGPHRDGDAVPKVPQYLFSREGLARYIMNCCQNKNGGLRDKPGK